MFLKVVVIFLLVMMLIGMLGKLFNPEPKPRKKPRRKCSKCGRTIIGTGPCPRCARKGK